MMATFTVVNTNDSGAGSLRQAIINANANSGADLIDFNIGGGGAQTISLSSQLDLISEAVTIDATTQGGYGGTPLIELNGAAVTGHGLWSAATVTIKGFAINGFSGSGIALYGVNGSLIEGNYLGTNLAGTAGLGMEHGISVEVGSSNVTVKDNVISGNAVAGIIIEGSGASGNVIIGNKIGTNAAGTTAIANATGVYIQGANLSGNVNGNRIGTDGDGVNDAAERNIISGNTQYGVRVGTNGTTQGVINTVIAGNYIGTNAAGTGAIANATGVLIVGANTSRTTIGWDTAGVASAMRNVISGNTTAGVRLTGDTHRNNVAGNYIGTNAAGTAALANGQDGVQIELGAHDNVVGGNGSGTVIVKDIVAGSGLSDPKFLTNVNGTLFFQATSSGNGVELWKTDGTRAGTVLVKDINSGAGNSNPTDLTNVNGTLFFVADDGVNGKELWKSDGTAAGTVMVKDIRAGSATSFPRYLTDVNGTLFFSAYDDTNGFELWKSDGTTAGTVLVKDIFSGATDSNPRVLTNVNGTLYFAADDGVNGEELWKSDGTAGGTVLVKDIPGLLPQPRLLTNVNGTLFFTAFDTTNGRELWKSDGTAAGTVLVKDIFAGSTDSNPFALTNVNGTLFFSASDGVNGEELWKSDGTAAGTVMVKDVPGNLTQPRLLTNVNGTLYYAAYDATNGRELWKSDGTAAGTFMIKDIFAGATDSNPSNLTNVNGVLYFTAENAANGRELWKTDGTLAGTVIVMDISAGTSGSDPGSLVNLNGALYFSADNGVNGRELWKSGGTATGAGNVISGNTGIGVSIAGASTHNVIEGNFIGTNAAGTAAVANQTGIYLDTSGAGALTNTRIGTDGDGVNDANERNIISGNTQYGIWVGTSGGSGSVTNTVIAGNHIGTNAAGTGAIGNATGVLIVGANTSDTKVGWDLIGDATAMRNVISGNNVYGVRMGGESYGNKLHGNYIGLASDGTTSLLNGTTSAGAGVRIDSDATTNTVGGNIATGQRNVINGFVGIDVDDASVNTISGNYIGTDSTGLAAGGGVNGVRIRGGSQNVVVGGTVAGNENIISGNTAVGVIIEGAGTSTNLVARNLIGLDKDGTAALANGAQGVLIQGGATGNTIGGTAAGAGNVIGGNAQGGVALFDSGTENNTIAGNLIGLNAAGDAAIANQFYGVFVVAASANTIGGTTAGARNVISGNNGSGIGINDVGAVDNVIRGNYIGTNAAGTAAIANTDVGIEVVDAARTIIGGSVAGAGNVISGNTNDGVKLIAANDSLIAGNFIGTNAAGTVAIGNGASGVWINAGDNNTIGGTTTNARNVISGNATGIKINSTIGGSSADDNIVRGNYVGTNAAGTAAIANGAGIEVGANSLRTVVGGTAAGAGNVISGSTTKGLILNGNDVTVQGNLIGTNHDGTVAIGNTEHGITINGASDVLIGGSTAAARNIISGNTGVGIAVGHTNDLTIEGNYVGLDTTGNAALANGTTGVTFGNTADTVLFRRNVVSGNADYGVSFGCDNINNVRVEGNFLGTNAAGTTAIGNGIVGLSLAGNVSNFVVGGITAAERNVISGNAIGIQVATGASGTSGYVVQGNYVGVGGDGLTALGNHHGFRLGNLGSISVRIGSNGDGVDDAAERNVISGNVGAGIHLSGQGAGLNLTSTTIAGNWIGIANNGSADIAVANGTGVLIDGTGPVIGARIGWDGAGDAAAMRNVISGNTTDGVKLIGATNTVIAGNFIGTNSAGTGAIANNVGVKITDGTTGTVVGGVTADARNIISGNTDNGVIVFDAATQNNAIRGNYIGVDVSGNSALGNGTQGVLVSLSADFTTIGGDVAGAGNLISGNGFYGIQVNTAGTTGTVIAGNRIGTNAAGTGAIENLGGVSILNATDTTVGGTTIAARNIISGNTTVGVNNDGATRTIVRGNYIGTNASGAGALGNGSYGVLSNATITIGGLTDLAGTGAGNVVSGNLGGSGISLVGALNSIVQGNILGLNATGTASLGFQGSGVALTAGSHGTTVGGADPRARNIIAGNADSLLRNEVYVTSTNNAVVEGNYIGVNRAGTAGFNSGGYGVRVENGADNQVRGNVISGTDTAVVAFWHADRTIISGNLIGTNATGTAVIGNAYGVKVTDHGGITVDVRIGSNGDGVGDESERNIISGSSVAGILIDGTVAVGSDVANTAIAGNYIGTDITGTVALGNTIGIRLMGVAGAAIGTNAPSIGMSAVVNSTGMRNVISGNTTIGVEIQGGIDIAVLGNYIGLDSTGNVDLGNGTHGILVDGSADDVWIGTLDAGAGNVISGNDGDGIRFHAVSNIKVAANRIGTNAAGTAAMGNRIGIYYVNLGGAAANVQIGTGTTGDVAAERNIISGNAIAGITFDEPASNASIRGNWIGLDATGSQAIGNGDGIQVVNSPLTIGSPGRGNVISGNRGDAISLRGANFNSTIEGNIIGLDANGRNVPGGGFVTTATYGGYYSWYESGNLTFDNTITGGTTGFGNARGIYVATSGGAVNIGGAAAGQGNTISGNQLGNVYSDGTNSSVLVLGNTIGLQGDGATAVNMPVATRYGIGLVGMRPVLSWGIGGLTDADANTISNNDVGVYLSGSADGMWISKNKIGTDRTGTYAVSSRQRIGIQIESGATGSQIDGNVISGNTYRGVDINGAAPPASMLGWYEAEENGNNLLSSSNGITKLGNATLTGVTFDTGNYGQAFRLGGAGAKITVPNTNGVLSPTDLLVEASFKLDPSVDPYSTLFEKVGPTGGWRVDFVRDGADIRLQFSKVDGAGNALASVDGGPFALTAGWHHYAVSIDAGGIGEVWFDGVSHVDSSSIGPVAANQADLTIGGGGPGAVSMAGLIDGIGIFRSRMSDDVMASLGNAVINPVWTPPTPFEGRKPFGVHATSVTNNRIGTDTTGTIAIGNGLDGVANDGGVFAYFQSNNASSFIANNVVSGNRGDGIWSVSPLNQSSPAIANNMVGVDAQQTKKLGNIDATLGNARGIAFRGGDVADNTIGGNNIGVEYLRGPFTFADTIVLTANDIGTNGNFDLNLGNGVGFATTTDVSTGTIADNHFAYNNVGYRGQYYFGNNNNFFYNNTLAIDTVGTGAQRLNNAGDGRLDMPIIESAYISGGQLIVKGFAPYAGADIHFFYSDLTTSGFGQGGAWLFRHEEGVLGDLDATAGTYGPTFQGKSVSTGSVTTERFEFRVATNLLPTDYGIGSYITALTKVSTPPRISEFGNLVRIADGPTAIATSDAASIFTPASLTPAADGRVFSDAGYFVDSDSTNWVVSVDYGDGSNPAVIPYYRLAPGTATSAEDNLGGAISRFGFALDHTYTSSGTYTIKVTVTDDLGATTQRTITTIVNNQAPVFDVSRMTSGPTAVEGRLVVLSGAISDTNTANATAVEIDWGDGSPRTAATIQAGRFVATHTYRNDGTATGGVRNYDIRLHANDSQGGTTVTAEGRFTQTVVNRLPVNLNLGLTSTSFAEGFEVALPLSFVDEGVLDSHKLRIDWGDGSPQTVVDVPPNANGAALRSLIGSQIPRHRYVNRTGVNESYTITVSVADDSQPDQLVSVSRTITIQAEPISISLNAAQSVFAAEGSLSTFVGSINDASYQGSRTLTIQWDDGSPVETIDLGTATTFTVKHEYADNRGSGYAPSFQVSRTDVPTRAASATFASTAGNQVTNAAPVITSAMLCDAAGNPITGSITEGTSAKLKVVFADAGKLDGQTITIDWADGVTETFTVTAGATTLDIEHTFRDNTPGPVRVNMVDKDGGQAVEKSVAVMVTNAGPKIDAVTPFTDAANTSFEFTASVTDPGVVDTLTYVWTVRNSANVEVASRTTGPTLNRTDALTLTNLTGSTYTLTLVVTDKDNATRSYTTTILIGSGADDEFDLDADDVPAGLTAITVLGLGGEDTIDASLLDEDIDVVLDGGAGDDTLIGSSGKTTFVMHQGNDTANGAAGTGVFVAIPNSEHTIIASDGPGNVLDFSLANFGVKFDTSMIGQGRQDVDNRAAGAGQQPNLHFINASGSFSTIVGSTFGDRLTATSGVTLDGGGGSDQFVVNTGSNVAIRQFQTPFFADATSTVSIGEGALVAGLSFFGNGKTLLQNQGTLTNATLAFTGDGAGTGGGFLSFTNTSAGTISGTLNIAASGSGGVIFNNFGSMTATSGSVLNFTGDGTGTGGGFLSFFNATSAAITGSVNISFSGSGGILFTNFGSMSGGTSGSALNFTGDGTGAGGGFFSFFNNGSIDGTAKFAVSGSTGVFFTNSGTMSGGTTTPALNFTGDGTGTGGGFFSFTNTGSISGAATFAVSGSTGVFFTNSGTMSGGATTPVLNFTGDGTGTGGGFFSFTNTGSISGAATFAVSGSTGVFFTNSGTMSGGATTPVLNFTGDGTGTGGGFFSFLNTGSISGAATFAVSGSTGVFFTNSGSMSTGSTAPALTFTGDGTGTGGGFLSFTNTSTGSIAGVSFSVSGSTGVFFTNSGTISAVSSTATAPTLNFTGDGTGTGGGFLSFHNASTGSVLGTTNVAYSGSGTVLFSNYGSMSAAANNPVLNFTGDGTGTGGGFVSFHNATSAAITGSVNISLSGSGGILFTNFGSMSGGASGSVLNFTGDGTGTGGGFFSFNNASTGTILGNTTVSVSGSAGVLFTNSGTIGSTSSSASFAMNFTGDGTGTGGGFVSFHNASTGTIYQPVVISTSGLGTVFTNSGTIGSSSSTGPILQLHGDGQAVRFANTGTGSIRQTVVIEQQRQAGVQVFSGPAAKLNALVVNGGQGDDVVVVQGGFASIAYDGRSGTRDVLILGNSTAPDTVSATGGTVSFTTTAAGGLENDLNDLASITFHAGDGNDFLVNRGNRVGQITFHAGGGSNQLTNLGTTGGIAYDAQSASTFVNLLVNRGAAMTGLASPATITMIGGDGTNILNNFATAIGYAIDMVGGSGSDMLYNEAANLPSIKFHSGGSQDRGGWGFPVGDILHNLGGGVGSIEYHAPADGSPNWLMNSGNNVGTVVMYGGLGFNLLQNYGSNVEEVTLLGGTLAAGEDAPPLPYTTGTGSAYVGLPDRVDWLINRGEAIGKLKLDGGYNQTIFENYAANVEIAELDGGQNGLQFANSSTGVALKGLTIVANSGPTVIRNSANGLEEFTVTLGDGSDVFENDNGTILQGTIHLGGGNNTFVSRGGSLTNVTIVGGSGNDTLINRSLNADAVAFNAGGGNNVFVNDTNGANNISFNAGSGNDTAVNFAAEVVSFVVYGHEGDDTLANYGSGQNFTLDGGDGNDTLQNYGGVDVLQLLGGDGHDRLVTSRATVVQVLFDGGDGHDVMNLVDGEVTDVDFVGGEGNDNITISAQVIGSLQIDAGGGRDNLWLSGIGDAVAAGAVIDLGSGNDAVQLGGVLRSSNNPLTIQGNEGDDHIIVLASFVGPIVLAGGSGSDTYDLIDVAANITIAETYSGTSDTSSDTLDFSRWRTSTIANGAAGVRIDLANTDPQENGPLSLRLSDALGVENVTGTKFNDVLLGNARNNNLRAARFETSPNAHLGQSTTIVAPSRTQWVYVDFEIATDADEYVYSEAERQAVVDQMNTYYRGSSNIASANPWFDFRAVWQFSAIPQAVRDSLQFAVVFVNANPQNGQPGGQASEIDPGNRNLGGAAVVQINGMLGGINQPAATSENFVRLTGKIAAHEVAHLLGLTHADAVGPIGFGTHTPLYPSQPTPEQDLPPSSFETTQHLISSPASTGSDRFSDLGDLYMGEQEAIQLALAFADPAATTVEEQATPTTATTPQTVELATLAVPNTLGQNAYHHGLTFAVGAKIVHGEIDLDAANAPQADYYRVYVLAGEVLTVASYAQLYAISNDYPDTSLALFDANGQLLASSDDGFETTDARIDGFTATVDGWYTVRIGSTELPGEYQLVISTFKAVNTTIGEDELKGFAGADDYTPAPGVVYEPEWVTQAASANLIAGQYYTANLVFADAVGVSWTATANYGDGTGWHVVESSAINFATKSVNLSYRYIVAGSHSALLRLTNDDGQIAETAWSVNVTPGVAAGYTLSPTNGSIVAGTSTTIHVTARDKFGNIATGYSGTASASSNDPLASFSGDVAFVAGVGSFAATLRTAGSKSVAVVDTSVGGATSGITGSTIINVSPGAASQFHVTGPSSQQAGVAFNLAVEARDAFQNIATGYTGVVKFTSNDSQAMLPADATLVGGAGVFSVTLKTAGSRNVTATDNANASIVGTTSVTVTPSAATHFVLNMPVEVQAGTSFSIGIQARDAYGNTDTAYAKSVTFASSDPAAILPSTVTWISGQAIVSATLNTQGSQSISLSDGLGVSGTATTQVVSTGLAGNAVIGPTLGDNFRLVVNNGVLEVYNTATGALVAAGAVSGITSITVNGTDVVHNTLTIDYAGVAITTPITFNGGSNEIGVGDTLVVLNAPGGHHVFNHTNAHDGNIVVAGAGTIHYTGLDPIKFVTTSSTVTVNLTNVADMVNVSYDNGPTALIVTAPSIETASLVGITRLIVNGLGGDDAITLDASLSGAGLETIDVNGGNGNDTIVVLGTGAATGTIAGGNDIDTLIVDRGGGTPLTFDINSPSAGTVSGGSTLAFNTTENLTGGAASDAFIIKPNGAIGQLNGGNTATTERDTLTVIRPGSGNVYWTVVSDDAGRVGTAVNETDIVGGFTRIENLIGSSANDTFDVTGGSAANESINTGNGTNKVTVNTGAAIADVLGGTGTDTVIVNGTVGSGIAGTPIQTADGGDVVNVGSTGVVNGSIDTGVGNDTAVIFGLVHAGVYGGAGNDQLRAGSTTSGFVNVAMRFYGEAGNDVLTGGKGNDLLDGGGDVDQILGNDGNDWIFGGTGGDLLRGNAGNDIIFGESGADQLIGDTGNDILIGGADNDLLGDSGGGYNVLLGGTGADTLTVAGTGVATSGNIMIGQSTIYDTVSSANIASLNSILAIWSNATSDPLLVGINERRNKLLSGDSTISTPLSSGLLGTGKVTPISASENAADRLALSATAADLYWQAVGSATTVSGATTNSRRIQTWS